MQRSTLLLVAIVGSTLWLAPPALKAAPSTTMDGVYNAAQMARGEKLTTKYCGACHDQSYFTGVFLKSWRGQPVQGLYDLIRQTMPRDRPGTLKERQYADVIAYIFALNGLPEGDSRLDYKEGRLAEVTIALTDDADSNAGIPATSPTPTADGD
ncbi:MAG: cytochrome c [Pseudomonadota bacterium]